MLDAGPTNPHTSLHLSGGLRVQRQIAGTGTEAPTSRSGPLFVQPSQLAASFVFSIYNVALIGPYRKWRDVRHESVMRSITDSQLERAVIGFSAPAAILRAS